MSVIDWIGQKFFGTKNDGKISIDLSDMTCAGFTNEIYIKNLAIGAAVNLIANGLAQSELLTFEKGKEVYGEHYYSFNVEPNANQNSTDFWRDITKKMLFENEAIVIQYLDYFYVVDSYTIEENGFSPNLYKDIVVAGKSVNKTVAEKDVLRFKFNDSNVKNIIDGVYRDYGKLIEYSKKVFKSNNSKRGILTIPTNYPQTPEAQEKLNKLMGENMKKFFEAETGAVLPLTDNFSYTDLSTETYKNASDSRDIRNLIDDIFDFVAIGFGVPPQLLKGAVVDSGGDIDKAVDRFILFRINPIAQVITCELNRKLYEKKLYLDKTYIKMDTSKIKLISLKELAGTIDILFRTGTNTINDNLKLLDREPSADKIANKRFVTKNYQELAELESGDKSNGWK